LYIKKKCITLLQQRIDSAEANRITTHKGEGGGGVGGGREAQSEPAPTSPAHPCRMDDGVWT